MFCGSLNGKGDGERMDTCMCMAESLCCPPETFTTLLIACVVQLLSRVQLFATPWTVAHKAYLSFTIFWSFLKFMSTESEMLSNCLILCHPLLLFPSIFLFYFTENTVSDIQIGSCAQRLSFQHQDHESFFYQIKEDKMAKETKK